MVSLFQRVETPEFCYISEAAHWIAIGRVPIAHMETSKPTLSSDYLYVDYRRGDEAMWDGEPQWTPGEFSYEEFLNAGIAVDYPRYLDVRSETEGQSAEAYFAREAERFDLARFEDSDDPELRKEAARMRQERAKYASQAQWVQDLEAEFDGPLDVARAAIFQALASGELAAEGWRRFPDRPEKPDDDDSAKPRGSFQKIPKLDWTFRGIDWEQSAFSSRSATYRSVQVRFADVLSRFPTPNSPMHEVNGHMCAGTLMIDISMKDVRPRSASRGRPSKISKLARDAVRNYFSHKARRGQAPDKAEALHAAVIEFVDITFGVKISRTTAQEYLRGLF